MSVSERASEVVSCREKKEEGACRLKIKFLIKGDASKRMDRNSYILPFLYNTIIVSRHENGGGGEA